MAQDCEIVSRFTLELNTGRDWSMSGMRAGGIVALISLIPTVGTAQQGLSNGGYTEPPVASATRTAQEIDLDGRLDEAVWATVVPVTEFTQVDPEEGRPVSQPTEVRILYDADALYIGIRAWDDGPITTRLGRRDMDLLDSDWFGVVIDSYHDHQTGFSFDVNPGGVQRDAVKSMQPGGHERDDLSWDAVWEVKASVDDEGWTAEYRIPFSQLRFRNRDEHQWGIQLERVIGRNREYAVSSFTPKNERGGIPTFGHLEGISGVRQGRRVELLPYGVTRSEHIDPGDNPFRTGSEQAVSGGLDLLYRATSNLTLNASFNPDFGQVEVDPAVVNLGVYETFFDEKRPFFVEGSEIFEFGRGTSGGRLFYSRRIGRPPQTHPETSAADVPTETTILGAAKLSGKTSGGWSLGMLGAVTGKETARYMTDAGTAENMLAEPLTGYFIGRVRKEMRAGLTSVGAMVTTTRRDLQTTLLQDELNSTAYSAGIDFNHEFSGRSWVIRGNVVGSRVEGSTTAVTGVQQASNHYLQRPDAEHLELDEAATSLSGYSASIALDKQAGAHWLGGIAGAITSPGYEVNDLGFAMRTDRRDLQGTFRYRETRPGSFFRDWSVSGRLRNEMNFDAQTILRHANLSYRFRHLSFWGGDLSVGRMFRSNDDRATRGGPIIVRPATTTLRASVFTDARKSVSLHADGDVEWSEFDGYRRSARIGLEFKPSSRWNLGLTCSLS